MDRSYHTREGGRNRKVETRARWPRVAWTQEISVREGTSIPLRLGNDRTQRGW